MLCDNCPYHRYEVYDDADDYCEIFGDFPDDERSRKNDDGCKYNMRTLKKWKRMQDEAFVSMCKFPE